MEEKLIVQRLKKNIKDSYSLAYKYYSILFAFNDLKLAKREIEFISFIAVKGNVINIKTKREFCKNYKTTTPTINNIISKMKKYKILIKKEGNIIINPVISLDFNKEIFLTLQFKHETTKYDDKGMAS